MTRAVVLLMLLGSGAAFAGIKDYVGPWHLSLHGKRCNIGFLDKKRGGGYSMAQKCPDAFGVQSAVAWKPFDGGIVFLSDTGVPVVTFDTAEDIYLSTNNPDLALRK